MPASGELRHAKRRIKIEEKEIYSFECSVPDTICITQLNNVLIITSKINCIENSSISSPQKCEFESWIV